MPPYAYDQHIGIQDLLGDWRLEQSEIDAIVAWVEAGAPMGDPENAPPPAQIKDPNEWNFAAQLGQPDLIVPSSSYDIPASGNDLWSNEFVDPGMTASRCIKAVQVKPREMHPLWFTTPILVSGWKMKKANSNAMAC